MKRLAAKLTLLVALGAGALIQGAWAGEWNQKTVLTFSGAVEIPGQVLPAGTYEFRLADSTSSRQIVQVFNKEGNHIYGTFLTIPDYRMQPAEKTIIHFHERPAGQPDAIKAWFYPGKNYGHVFVYPKTEARALAEANQTPVPALPAEIEETLARPEITPSAPEIQTMIVTPLLAEQPDGQEMKLAEEVAPAELQGAPAAENLPEQLPSTATSLPVFAVLGAVALLGALMIRLTTMMKPSTRSRS